MPHLKENLKGQVRCPRTNRLRLSENCFSCGSQGGQSCDSGTFYLWCSWPLNGDELKE